MKKSESICSENIYDELYKIAQFETMKRNKIIYHMTLKPYDISNIF